MQLFLISYANYSFLPKFEYSSVRTFCQMLLPFSAISVNIEENEYLETTIGFKFCKCNLYLQLRGNQVRVLNSRAAVSVLLHLISIVVIHEKGDSVLLRKSEYLLKALPCTTRNRKMERWFPFGVMCLHIFLYLHAFFMCMLFSTSSLFFLCCCRCCFWQ